MSNEYSFRTVWRIPAGVDEICGIFLDGADLVRWWPSVYLRAVELERGDLTGVGRTIDLHTKGLLPYTLRWSFTLTEVLPGRSIALEAKGDFVGTGLWTFEPDGDATVVTYDWRIRADKPLLRRFSSVMRPIFEANHRWAMDMGERSLLLELRRRRATSPEERAAVPPPPGPIPSAPFHVALGLLGLAAAMAVRRRMSHA